MAVSASHPYWTRFRPTTTLESRYPVYSLLWIRKCIPARQIMVASPYITIALVSLPDRIELLVPVYVPAKQSTGTKQCAEAAPREGQRRA